MVIHIIVARDQGNTHPCANTRHTDPATRMSVKIRVKNPHCGGDSCPLSPNKRPLSPWNSPSRHRLPVPGGRFSSGAGLLLGAPYPHPRTF